MLKLAWERFVPHWPILVLVTVISLVIQWVVGFGVGFVEGLLGALASGFAQERGGDAAQLVSVLVQLALSLGRTAITFPLSMFFAGALARMALSAARGQAPDISAFNHSLSRLLTLLGSAFCSGFLVLAGILCFIIPGMIVGLALQLLFFVVMDSELGTIRSIQYAWKLGWPSILPLLLTSIGSFFVAIIAVCGTCGVGLVVFQPVITILLALVYVQLSGRQADLMPDPEL